MRSHFLLARGGIFFAVFLVLHFLYDFFPNPVIGIFSGTSESVFQHLKIGFFSYLTAGLFEHRLLPGVVEDTERRTRHPLSAARSLYPWLAAAALVPWIIFLLYYLMPAAAGEVEHMGYHVAYSVLITYLSGLFAAVLRDELAEAPLGPFFRLTVLLLFAASLVIFLVFNSELPPLDLFELP